MKKVLFIILTLFLVSTFGLFLYSNQKKTELIYYSPYESKSMLYEMNREMSFDVYTKDKNSIISDPSNNTYTLKMEDMSFELRDIRITELEFKEYNIIRIFSSIPDTGYDEYSSQSGTLVISNPIYTLRLPLGPISIIKENIYPLLSIDALFGSYSYINGILILVGINLTLTNSYSNLESLRIGTNLIGNIRLSKLDISYANIMDIHNEIPSYSPKKTEVGFTKALESKEIFIPISYKTLTLCKSGYTLVKLDGEIYLIDTFDFMTNCYEFYEYESMMNKGEITYA